MPKRKPNNFVWENAPDIKRKVNFLKRKLNLNWINIKNIYFYRSQNSKSKAYARIWGLSKIWQYSLKIKPSYIIEVLSERFDKLNDSEKDKVILHELIHIPKNFSGSLLPHIRQRGKRNFYDKVNNLIKQKNNLNS